MWKRGLRAAFKPPFNLVTVAASPHHAVILLPEE
jgi:hypothetical protein